MKALIASFGLMFFSSASFAALSVTDFSQSADKNFSFKLVLSEGSEVLSGNFKNADVVVLNAANLTVKVKQLEKFVVIAAAHAAPKTVNGSVFILEEMNALYVPLTLAPMTGPAATALEDGLRMIEISRLANGGDLATGVQKSVEAFRQNPKLTIQAQLTKLAQSAKPGKIAVGERTKIQTVRSFEELEGGAPTTYVARKPRSTVRKRVAVSKPKPKTEQTAKVQPRTYARPTYARPTYVQPAQAQPGMRWLPQEPTPYYYY